MWRIVEAAARLTLASMPRRWCWPARRTGRASISVRLQKSHHELIAAIPEKDWKPIPYWLEGAAHVAEIPYRPFGKKRSRPIVGVKARAAGSPDSARIGAW